MDVNKVSGGDIYHEISDFLPPNTVQEIKLRGI